MQTGVVVIDNSFNILIWNYMLEDMWGLRSDEVLGKSLFSLDIGLRMEQLRMMIRDSISGRTQFQEIIIEAMNRRGRQIKCYVACTPLFGVHIEGAILVMADVEKVNSMVSAKEIEERQRQQD